MRQNQDPCAAESGSLADHWGIRRQTKPGREEKQMFHKKFQNALPKGILHGLNIVCDMGNTVPTIKGTEFHNG